MFHSERFQLINRKRFLKISAIGAFLSFVMLVLLSFACTYTREQQISYWTGKSCFDALGLANYVQHFQVVFALVMLYLLGHAFMWLGFGDLIFKKSSWMGIVVWGLGFFEVFLDLAEYALRSSFVKGMQEELFASSFVLLWWFVREMSVWMLIFLTSFVGVALFVKSKISSLLFYTSIVGVVVFACRAFSGCGIPWYLWLILWHLFSSGFLWQKAKFAD